jgi:hypothetical protein
MDQSGSTGDPAPTPATTLAPATTPAPATNWAAPPAPGKDSGKGFDVSDFLAFRYLVTPAFMTVIYVIGAIGVTLGALGVIVGGQFIGGLLLFIFGNLYWRIILEFVMVLFRMNDSLQSIDRRGKDM